ncbi:hypothetical protein G9C98_002792 [Cotesia typhae]|uniref:Uncharacterized protein n=1 Tax=Cotesia typhae TaxID=2053667 RepID=A0A8J5RJW3_9HYME|nr:hypothetical protein G9C98_002792 [Cotesia typhae]
MCTTLAVGKGCSLFWRSISKHLELQPELQQDRAREEQEQVYTQKLDVGDEEVSVWWKSTADSNVCIGVRRNYQSLIYHVLASVVFEQ